MHKLYGRGAVVLHDDRREYRPVNGVLEVPDHLLNRAKALGFTTYPLPTIDSDAPAEADAPADPAHAPPADLPLIDATKTDDELLIQFALEAMEAGYSEDAAGSIAEQRLRNLRGGGSGYSTDEPPSPASP